MIKSGILIYLDINKVAVMIFILLFFVYYDTVIKNTEKFFFKKRQRDENYNNRIEELLNELEMFKKITPYRYTQGYNTWVEFIKTLNKLESENLYNYSQYFENAHLYLKNACNIFMGMRVDSGSQAQQYIGDITYVSGKFSQHVKFVEIVHDYAANFPFQG